MHSSCHNLRVYYEDTDSGGVVYYANYLRYLERARTELLRDLGYEQEKLMHTDNIVFAVRSVTIDYLKPAHLDDELCIETIVQDVKTRTILFNQTVFHGNCNSMKKKLAEGLIKVVCLNTETFKMTTIPKRIDRSLKNGN